MNGADLLLYINTGTPTVPSYEAVGSQRDCSIEEASETIDNSSKDSRAQRVDYGRYSSSLSLDSLYVPSDVAYQALKAANRDGDMILIARYESGTITETALAKIDTISETFPDQSESTVAIAFTIDDMWSEVGS